MGSQKIPARKYGKWSPNWTANDLRPERELGWRSGENARLSPICPGSDSRTRRHVWVEFVVVSRPSTEGFSPGSPVFLPPQKSTFLNSNSIGNSKATSLSVENCYVPPSLNKVNLFHSFKWSPSDCTANDPRSGNVNFAANEKGEWTQKFGQWIYFINSFS